MKYDDQNSSVPESVDEALWLFQRDLPTLVKDKKGQVGNQLTKYADLNQANEVVLTRLNALGCIWVCEPKMISLGEHLRFVLAWELKHVQSDTKRHGDFPVLGDAPMKQGAAITYARRYALMAVTGVIPEDEDDDGRSFQEDGQAVARRAASGRARQAARPEGERVSPPARSGNRPPLPGEDEPPPGQLTDDENRRREKGERPRQAGAPPPPAADGEPIDAKQNRHMQALFAELGYGGRTDKARTTRLEVTAKLAGLPALDSSSDLSWGQAETVIGKLAARRDTLKAEGKLPGQQAAESEGS